MYNEEQYLRIRSGHIPSALFIFTKELKEYRKALSESTSENKPYSALEKFLGWLKSMHTYSTIEIMELDKKIREIKKDRAKKSLLNTLEYYRHIWRRYNDAIVWSILEERRYLIKRFCFFENRSPLPEQYPESIESALHNFNSDAFDIAIWNDTTSCMDIGDILYRNFITGDFKIIEVKEGKVNEELMSIKHGDQAGLNSFLIKYGKKGEEQLKRYSKQVKKNLTVSDLIVNEQGIDPLTGENWSVSESKILDETYDSELQNLITTIKKEDEGIICIDNCLWIYGTMKPNLTNYDVTRSFTDLVRKNGNTELFDWLQRHLNKKELSPIFSLSQGFLMPLPMPIFLKELEMEDILSLIFNKIQIFFFIDWLQFQRLFEKEGLKFGWSSKKQGRREKAKSKFNRTLIIGERIPMISTEEYQIFLGEGAIDILFNSGIKPHIYVKQLYDMHSNIIKG